MKFCTNAEAVKQTRGENEDIDLHICLFETRPHYAALATLDLFIQTILASNSQGSTYV